KYQRRDLARHYERGECIWDRTETAGLHQDRATQAAHPGAGYNADGFFLSCGGKRREKLVGVKRLDKRSEHPVGHVNDEFDVIRFERRENDLVPGGCLYSIICHDRQKPRAPALKFVSFIAALSALG